MELLLPCKTDLARIRARREDDAERFDSACGRLDLLDVLVELQPDDLGGQELRAESARLLFHLRGELRAADLPESRVVDDIGGDGDLPARFFLLDDEHLAFGTREVDCGGESRRAAADDDRIIHFVHPYTPVFS